MNSEIAILLSCKHPGCVHACTKNTKSNQDSFGNSFGNSWVSLSLRVDQTSTGYRSCWCFKGRDQEYLCEEKQNASHAHILKNYCCNCSRILTALPLGGLTDWHTPQRKASFKWRTNMFTRDDLLAVILEQLYLRLFITIVQSGKSAEVWEV